MTNVLPPDGRNRNDRVPLLHAFQAASQTTDMTASKSAGAALPGGGKVSAGMIAGLLDALPAAVYATDSAGRIIFFNKAAVTLWGRAAELGKTEWCGSLRLFWPDGSPIALDECPMAVALKEQRAIRGAEAIVERADGSRVPFVAYPTPLFDKSGVMTGAVNMMIDITERKRAREQQDLLLGEMSHRVKNVLAVASGLVTMSARGAASPQDMAVAVQNRLAAFARAHELTRPGLIDGVPSKGSQTTLHALIETIVAPYTEAGEKDATRCIIDGGHDVPVGASAATNMALILHEFTTNAAKYGALSSPDGHIRISAAVADGILSLKWDEQGGPALQGAPSREGFGSMLARRTVGGQFDGKLSYDWRPEGVMIDFQVPLTRLAQETA